MARAKNAAASPLWGGLGVAFLLIGWEAGHRVWGSLVLPGLGETAAALWQMIAAGKVGPALLRTAADAGTGWLAAPRWRRGRHGCHKLHRQ